MLRLYVLFPHAYAHELEPDRALGSIEDAVGEKFGDEATVVAWEVCDGPAPDALLPPTMMKAIKAVAEKGGMDPFLAGEGDIGETATYATLQCPPPHRVGVCIFSDRRLKKHHRWHRRKAGRPG